MRARSLLLALSMMLLSAACDRSPPPQSLHYSRTPPVLAAEYRLAIHPLHHPRKLAEVYQPLVDYLNRQLPGMHIDLEATRNFQAYEQKFRDRAPAFLLLNPWQAIEAMNAGYHVIAMAGDAEDFKGLFLVRKDSGIKTPADLRGKVVSYPSPTALAAAIMPQYYLHRHGIDIKRDIRNSYVGSQESSIMNVYLGKSAAGASWPPAWRLFQRQHPAAAAQLEPIWETPPLLNNAVMVRDDVPAAVREQLRTALLRMAQRPEGQAILSGMETARFHPADDASYDPVRRYIARFEREVRPVERE